jgi:hypothetical protein
MVITVVPATTGLGNEIINPLAQIENTYNDFDFKKLNGNFGLDYKLFEGFVLSSSLVLIPQIASQEFCERDKLRRKSFDVQRSSVTQNAVNNYSFDVLERTPKKLLRIIIL